MRKWLYGIISVLLLAGCSAQEEEWIGNVVDSTITPPSYQLGVINNYIRQTKGKGTRSNGVSIHPILHNGDTLMYVANYIRGGFEIFSNNTSLPMVLVKSKNGSYFHNPIGAETPLEEHINHIIENIARIQFNSCDTTQLWTIFEPGKFSESPEAITRGSLVNVGIGIESVQNEYFPKNGRLKTKWHQNSPYNDYAPFLSDYPNVHAPAGCVPVAVGQYLYFVNRKFGLQLSIPTQATYNSGSKKYEFSGYSQSSWGTMDTGDKFNDGTQQSRYKNTAILLAYLGKMMYTSYATISTDGSSTTIDYWLAYLDSVFGRTFTQRTISFSGVKAILSTGYPVMIHGRGYQKTDAGLNYGGHAYLIDYALAKSDTFYDVYADSSKIKENGSGDDEDDGDGDGLEYYGHPLKYYREKYGEISLTQTDIVNTNWYAMNWGWGSKDDEVLFSADIDEILLSSENSEIKFNYFYIIN